jgi:SNF2 family DNA or RNA helicase
LCRQYIIQAAHSSIMELAELLQPTTKEQTLIAVEGMPYFEHQEIAVRWMLNLETAGLPYRGSTIRGGLLADDMGLGKTLEICGLIANGGSLAHQTLIVAPLALLDNWIKMGHKAGFGVWVFGPKGWEPQGKPCLDVHQVYVVNYDKLLQQDNHDAIIAYAWDRVVLDEAHKIRNAKTRLFKACKQLHAPRRWAVTGTPIVNSLNDAVVLFDFIGVPAKTHVWDDVAHIPLIDGLVLHRTLDSLRSVVKDAPPVPQMEKIVLPFITAEEEEFYLGIQGAIKAEARALRYHRHAAANATILKMLLRLRQISVHPQIYRNAHAREMGCKVKEWEHGSTKFEAVRSILQSDMETAKSTGEPHKYIFICHFADEIALLKEFLEEEAGLQTVVSYSGGMTQTERRNVLEKLETADHEAAICLQLQAGGVGLNLQCCDRVFFLSPWWTSALMDQAIARAVRMGQQEVVQVYTIALQMEEDPTVRNIDAIIHEKATYKGELARWFFEAAGLAGVIQNALDEASESEELITT